MVNLKIIKQINYFSKQIENIDKMMFSINKMGEKFVSGDKELLYMTLERVTQKEFRLNGMQNT